MANILSNWSNLLKVNLEDWLVSFGSGYGRRLAEPYYDKIARTDFFQRLMKKESSLKYFLEAANNAFVSYLSQQIDDAGPLRQLLKEIFMDSSSELNKRLINGDSVKNLLASGVAKLKPAEKDFLAALLMMKDEELKPFAEELATLDEESRKNLLKVIRGRTAEEMLSFATLDSETRKNILTFFEQPKKETFKKISGAFSSAKMGLDEFLRERLKRKEEKRNGRDNKFNSPES